MSRWHQDSQACHRLLSALKSYRHRNSIDSLKFFLVEETCFETPETSSQMQNLWKSIPLRIQGCQTLSILQTNHRYGASPSFAKTDSRPERNLPSLQ